MAHTIEIPARFNGPLDHGNGGYCCGVVAGQIGGAADVSLRHPVPLDTPLDLSRDANGTVRILDGDTLIAEGQPSDEVELNVPAAVSPEEARRAAERYAGPYEGLFSNCFVCGRTRQDSFGVFAGSVDGRDIVATPWTPPSWAAGDDGAVSSEFVWSVLDCPTYFATYTDGNLPVSFLARMTGRVDSPVLAGEEHVVVAWPIGTDGRKRHAGSAVMSADGVVLAVARALMIEPKGS